MSVFMKELKQKQRMTIAYNYAHDRRGTLWEGRFKCTLVHYGEALRAVAAYIDLNCRKRLAVWHRVSLRAA